MQYTSSSRATGNLKDPRSKSCHRRKTTTQLFVNPLAALREGKGGSGVMEVRRDALLERLSRQAN